MGSEFHWTDRYLGTASVPPEPPTAQYYATATAALRTLVAGLPGAPAVHLPSFYCLAVAESLLAAGIRVAWYPMVPGAEPQVGAWRPGDVVVLAGLFGAAVRHPPALERVVVVEDHTHDPDAVGARESTADFCLASLRKTLPLPDGAVVWSPRGLAVPPPEPGPSRGGTLKLSAMRMKAAWLAGGGGTKDRFRAIQVGAEETITDGASAPTGFTLAALPRLDRRGLRAQRARNAARLRSALTGCDAPWRILETTVAGEVPFHLQLVCAGGEGRDDLRRFLGEHGVYAAVHWPQPWRGIDTGDPRARSLAARILTLPTDHRYEARDMDRLAAIVHAYPARTRVGAGADL